MTVLSSVLSQKRVARQEGVVCCRNASRNIGCEVEEYNGGDDTVVAVHDLEVLQ